MRLKFIIKGRIVGMAFILGAFLARAAGFSAEAATRTPSPAPAAGYQPSGYAVQPWAPGMAMAAYQRAYAMNFEIWKPTGLPTGWYATFDGFPVAQVAENRWVYGKVGLDGAMVPTDVLVGSVVPAEVPGLARIAQVWEYARYIHDPEFLKIRNYRCDRMAYLNDPFVHTAIAWNSQEIPLWIWLGDRWKKLTPRSGEYTWQMLKRYRSWLAERLRENNVWWIGEGEELADLARQWGMLWFGSLAIEKVSGYNEGGGGDHSLDNGGTVESATQDTQKDSGPGNWDVE
ncbi:MAG: hypothetical protein IJU98_00485 [Synergistaceae bacterium]|nr:hypothetical protein [Synergistaceae bacterium]